MKPIVWTIAGSDPGGGAGIQADVKTFNDFNVHDGSVITALIAQNTLGVQRVDFTPPALIAEQLASLRADLPPAAVKIGMLGTAAAARVVAAVLRDLKTFAVYDPVMGAGGGESLMTPDLLPVLLEEVLPLVDVLAPNAPEITRLTGRTAESVAEIPDLARALLALGPRSVLLKGGHLADPEFSQDYWTDGRTAFWLTSPRIAGAFHGTGCALSSALAACRALGHEAADAAVVARAYVNQGMRLAEGLGQGRRPIAHGGWPASPEDAPWMTDSAAAGRRRLVFPNCGPEPIGLYPIVDRATWLEKLIPLGVRIVQLRAKDLAGDALEREVREAVRLARPAGLRLVINDRADLAMKYGAWGVHLGPEDVSRVDLNAVAAAGLRLGISAYGYADVARALALRPSYVAIGAIFPTPSKALAQAPLGLEAFTRMRRWIQAPVVAIGGVTLENARPLLDAGADGIAVISDLYRATPLAARIRAWNRLFSITAS